MDQRRPIEIEVDGPASVMTEGGRTIMKCQEPLPREPVWPDPRGRATLLAEAGVFQGRAPETRGQHRA